MKRVSIGFTGTRSGMTRPQIVRVQSFLSTILELNPESSFTVVHGGAEGADEQFHALALLHRIDEITVFPSDRPGRLGRWFEDLTVTTLHEPMPPLERNHLIMDQSHLFLAAPSEHSKGTYHAASYAIEELNLAGFIVYDDGTFRAYR